MRLLYGVCGEGMGHAIRSSVVAEHLMNRGHSVHFVSSPGKARDYLVRRWPGRMTTTIGLNMSMEHNRVLPVATLAGNFFRQLAGSFHHIAAAIDVPKVDAVVSDFDAWTANYAGFARLPLVALDNVHFLSRCTHPREVIASDRTAAALMYPIVRNTVVGAGRYLVTTFIGAPVSAPNTSLHLPVIRPAVLAAPRSSGDHVVAYFNDKADHGAILSALSGVPARFHLYGTGVGADEVRGNVTLKPSSDGVIGDMASSRAVIGGAGFTLMTEAIYLGKPMLAVPFEGQFEQILNANYLQRAGFGERAHGLTPQTVSGFLSRTEAYRRTLAGVRHDGNQELFCSLERALS